VVRLDGAGGAGWHDVDEFAIRPEFDRTARAILLGTGLLVLGISAGLLIWAWVSFRRALSRGRLIPPSSEVPPMPSSRVRRTIPWVIGCVALVALILGGIHLIHTVLNEIDQKRLALRNAEIARVRAERLRTAR